MNITDLKNELDRCAKCGQCRSVCPVFLALKDETLVARGRLAIIHSKNQSGSSVPSFFSPLVEDERLARILDTCLMCRRCEDNCPSLVDTSAVFKSERRRLVREKGLPPLLRIAFRWILPTRWLYDIIMKLMAKIPSKKRGFRGVSSSPIRHLPLYFTNLFQRMPRLAIKSALASIEHRAKSKNGKDSTLHAPLSEAMVGSTSKAAHREARSTPVTIFVGCAANYIYPEIIEALTSILDQLKIPYVIPQAQVCCGMPALLSGDDQSAQRLMKINQEVFNADTIITVCPTCNRMLSEEYALTGVKVIDAVEFLNETSDFVIRHSSLDIRSTYHTPCHSAGTKAPEIIKGLLKANTDYQEIDDICCGGGGLFTFKYPELSDMIAKARVDSLNKALITQSPNRPITQLVTNCPGCMMQLEYLLASKPDIRVRHILSLLTAFYKTGQPVPHTHK